MPDAYMSVCLRPVSGLVLPVICDTVSKFDHATAFRDVQIFAACLWRIYGNDDPSVRYLAGIVGKLVRAKGEDNHLIHNTLDAIIFRFVDCTCFLGLCGLLRGSRSRVLFNTSKIAWPSSSSQYHYVVYTQKHTSVSVEEIPGCCDMRWVARAPRD